jgi:hypothetical protein
MTPTNIKMNLDIDDRLVHCMHCGNKGKALIKKGFNELLKNKEDPN